MPYNENTGHIYNTAPDMAVCYKYIYSYTKEAGRDPIAFSHYCHYSHVPPYTSHLKDNDWYNIFISLSGNFSFILNDNLYSPRYGDVFFVKKHEPYASIFHSSSEMDYYEIDLPADFFEHAFGAEVFAAPFFNRRSGERNLLRPITAESHEIIQKLKLIESLCLENKKNSDVLIYSHLIQMMEMLSSIFSNQSLTHSSNKVPLQLQAAIMYIQNHFASIESIDEVAKACNISTAYMTRLFKQHIPCSPNNYIINLRISNAKRMLAAGASLTEACYKSGFSNYTYFISKFKSVTGTTPAKFKREME